MIGKSTANSSTIAPFTAAPYPADARDLAIPMLANTAKSVAHFPTTSWYNTTTPPAGGGVRSVGGVR